MPICLLSLRLTKSIKLLFILFVVFWGNVRAESINVAVASNFIAPAQEIAKLFEKETGHQIKISSGSSGKFFAQIQNGAPFHVLLSADTLTPAKLLKEGFAIPSTQITYAIGKLVLWSSNAELVTGNDQVLDGNKFKKIAIANPELAPYGVAAIETLKHLGQYQHIKTKIVWGENIAQAHQFVLSGNAELGFVSASQVMRDGKLIQGSAWIVPDILHSAILQDAVLLNKGRDSIAARSFLIFLASEKVKKIIQEYGYGTPEKKSDTAS
jgi:molybdate transport system substrate-binding protein